MKLRVIALLTALTGLIVLISSCESEEHMEYMRYYTQGKLIYQKRCQNCHGGNGEGLSNLMPPLTDSLFLRKNKAQLPCIVNFGLKEKLITVHGKTFTGTMPAVNIPPVDIAEVLTYVTNSFGNKMGVTTSEQVTKQLQNCK